MEVNTATDFHGFSRITEIRRELFAHQFKRSDGPISGLVKAGIAPFPIRELSFFEYFPDHRYPYFLKS